MLSLIILSFSLLFGSSASAQDLVPKDLEKAVPTISSITYIELRKHIIENDDVLILDVRTAEEYASGTIPGAILFPYDELESRKGELAQLVGSPDRLIVVFCRSGFRSSIAADTLLTLGYTQIADFGSISNWRGALKR